MESINNHGFSNIGLILFLPLLLSLCLSTYWIVWFMQKNMQLENLCNHFVLKAQESLVLSNNQIMSLNPKASWLFWEKKALNTTILTGPPPAKAAAKIRKRFVILQQKALKKLQQSLFLKSSTQSSIAMTSLQKEFRSYTRKVSSQWNKNAAPRGVIWALPKKSQLQQQLRDIAPTYERANSHWADQGITAQWNIPLKEILPKWIQTWVPIQKQWKGSCASHPHKGATKWKAAIGEGKP